MDYRPDPLHVAMNSYDILLHLFDHLQSCQKGSSCIALTSCARVCRAWQEPASYVLWRKLPALHPLWNLLIKRDLSPDAKWLSPFWQFIDVDDFVSNLVARERETWTYFLRRASHVREVGIAACGHNELALIRALTEYNKGKSLLPSLQRLSWRHAVPADMSVFLLSSPCLRDLEIAVSPLGTESGITPNSIDPEILPKVDPMFVRLAGGAPVLRRLILSGRQGPGSAIVPHLLQLTHLRELLLYNQSISLNPEQMSTVFRHMGDLETLDASIVDFVNTDLTVDAPSLRILRLKGDLPHIQALLSGYLRAAFIHSLTLQASDEKYSWKIHHDRSDVAWNDTTSHSYSTIIEPLFALKDLENIHICLANCLTPFTDVDVAAIAQAWNRVQKLHITYVPLRSHARPPLTSLQHFADYCPQLRQLGMTRLAIPDVLDLPPIPRPRAHPLHRLDLKVAFARDDNKGRLEKAAIARYLDYLFPNLILHDQEMHMSEGCRLHGTSLWQEVEQEIRLLRENRQTATSL